MPKTEVYSHEHYKAVRNAFEFKALVAAAGVSEDSGGIKTSTRYIRTTQLYTRMTIAGFSFLKLLPGSSITHRDDNLWDWPSVACIARNMVETYHAFWYLADPDLSEQEVEMRLWLMHLHSNSEKYRLYKEWGAEQDILREFEEGLPMDKARLESNTVFASLPDARRKDLLKGKKAMHLSHGQIGESLPFMTRHFRPIYRLFSNQVHASPFSFQSQSNERGRGLENEAERGYITLATQVVTKYLTSAVIEMGRIFPETLGARRSRLIDLAREAHEE